MSGIPLKYTLKEAFASFIETDSAQKTKRSFKADIRFLDISLHYFMHVRQIHLVREVRLEDLQTLQIWLAKEQVIGDKIKEPWTDTTIELYCRILKKFFRKMFHTDKIKKNPAEMWKVPRGTSERRRPMTPKEYALVYAAAPEWFKPILTFIYLTGSRGASAASLAWQDIDFEAQVLLLKSRKGGIRQVKVIPIPMYPALFDFMKAELAKVETRRTVKKADPVFWGPKGLSVTAQEISTEGSRLIRNVVGLSGVVLYGLRHAIAVELTQAGVPLEITRQAMGHSSINQTSHYAQGIASKTVSDALNQIRKK